MRADTGTQAQSKNYNKQPIDFYAHSRPEDPGSSTWQPLEEHLRKTAQLARAFASVWGAGDWAYYAGLWHDIGKYSQEFQKRICDAGGADAHIETSAKVDHSSAGAQHSAIVLKEKGFGKAIAYAIAGHHGGLPDGISADSCLRSRLEKRIPDYHACPSSILNARSLSLPFKPNSSRAGMQISMFIRMLFSALVDADFLDTEAFLNKDRSHRRRGYKTLNQLEPRFFERLSSLSDQAARTHVNEQRRRVLSQCVQKAECARGIFSLTVPTGGGKTLSSMAFALNHALKHGLTRIIYVIPFTSIIEQNADVFRKMLGEDAVLEHHSNFDPEHEDHRSRLAAENWDAPIVVTTNVQFYESLFANRSSQCRKLHNIANSVIILDEVQTLPVGYLLPCIAVLRELAANYGSTVVLCSATQPAILSRAGFSQGLEGVSEIVDDPGHLSATLRRTRVTVLSRLPDADLVKRLVGRQQVLCVVNTRNHARDLHAAISDTKGLFHLSALMCPVHRSQKLRAIRERLKKGEVCRVVSTQLIEAGVDIDFPVVYRALAGIDSVAQAAGRCNREGKLETGEVYVFSPEGGNPPRFLRQAVQATESVIRGHSDDILALEAIEQFFRFYYWTKGDELDRANILAQMQAGSAKGDFPFKTVAEAFRLIQHNRKSVVIPFDETARGLIARTEHVEQSAVLARALQKYTVSVFPGLFNRLLEIGSIELKGGLFPVLVDELLYSPEIGLRTDDPARRGPDEFYL